jgi:hypothetical protein
LNAILPPVWRSPAAAIFVAALVATLSPSGAPAFSGLVGEVPHQDRSIRAGNATAPPPVTARFDTRWFDGVGYRPARFRFELTPAPRDRTIDVALHAAGSRRAASSIVARNTLRVPKGATSVEGVLLAPQQGERPLQWVTVEIDGVSRPELSSTSAQGGSVVPAAQGNGRCDLRMLTFADGPAASALVGQGEGLAPPGQRSGGMRAYSALNGLVVDEAATEHFDEWLAYSSADVVVLDLADLQSLKNNRPSALAALRKWVVGGGNLWVTRVGDRAKSLDELAGLLSADDWLFDLQTQPEAEEGDDPLDGAPPAAIPGAAPPVVEAPDQSTSEGDAATAARSRVKFLPADGAKGWWHESLDARPRSADAVSWKVLAGDAQRDPLAGLTTILGERATSRGWFVSRPMGFGRVQAFPRAVLDSPRRLNAANLDLVGQRWRGAGWVNRHGFEPGVGCPDFGKMLIPGVGVAPVTEFQFLITLFVLAIGPLNYWLLFRAQRLHLLVLTTPLAAALVTAGLFVYAIVGDGFGTRVRARSLTLLNQAEGLAATWCHLSHYSGSAPANGMTFPRDTAVYPIDPFWEVSLAPSAAAERGLRWTGDGQRLAPGWLASRTAAQHLAVRCGATKMAIEVASRGSELSARNRLGTDVELLLVSSAPGEWRRAAAVAEGGSAKLQPVATNAAANELRLLFVENRPEFPLGAGKAVEDTLEQLGGRSIARRRSLEASAGDLDANLLSAGIDRIAGLDGGPALDLPPRSFVAVTRTATHAPLGGEGFQEAGGFHVVLGRW